MQRQRTHDERDDCRDYRDTCSCPRARADADTDPLADAKPGTRAAASRQPEPDSDRVLARTDPERERDDQSGRISPGCRQLQHA